MIAKVYSVNCDSIIVSPFNISLKKGDHIAIDIKLEKSVILGYGDKLKYMDQVMEIDRPYKIIAPNDSVKIEENDRMIIENMADKSMARKKRVKTK